MTSAVHLSLNLSNRTYGVLKKLYVTDKTPLTDVLCHHSKDMLLECPKRQLDLFNLCFGLKNLDNILAFLIGLYLSSFISPTKWITHDEWCDSYGQLGR